MGSPTFKSDYGLILKKKRKKDKGRSEGNSLSILFSIIRTAKHIRGVCSVLCAYLMIKHGGLTALFVVGKLHNAMGVICFNYRY